MTLFKAMTSSTQFHLTARFMIVLNFLAFLALGGVFARWVWIDRNAAISEPRAQDGVPTELIQEGRGFGTLLALRLEEIERNIRGLADLASNIFTHPDSYRMAPQPGEYDYNTVYGVYGSVKPDGTPALLLSAATPLTSEILHDIRLAEYLGPVFKSAVESHPEYLSVSLYTTDSLIYTYPWIDFPKLIKEGTLRQDFKVSELPAYSLAVSQKNPGHGPLWSRLQDSGKAPGSFVLGSAPFFSGDGIKGIVAVKLRLDLIAARLFESGLMPDTLALLLDEKDLVWGMSQSCQSLLKWGNRPFQPVPLLEILNSTPHEVQPVLQKLSGQQATPVFGAGEWVINLVRTARPPLRAAFLGHRSSSPSKQFRWTVAGFYWLGGVLFLALLLAVDSLWMIRIRRRLLHTSHQMLNAFSSLTKLDLENAKLQDPEGPWENVFGKFNESLQALQRDVNALPVEEIRRVALEGDIATASADLEFLSQKSQILGCFSAEDSVDATLAKLSDVLREIFSVEQAGFLFPATDDRFLRGQLTGQRASPEAGKGISLEIGLESPLGVSLDQQGQVIFNNQDSFEKNLEELRSLGVQNLMLTLLSNHPKRLGIIILANKISDFGAWDQDRLRLLRDPISRVAFNLLQCEGYRQIDSLRRQYCRELINVLDGPLNRIRTEVQSIYSRLGKLTPYYKEHCEHILFEVGRLYEIAHEASALDELSPESRPNP